MPVSYDDYFKKKKKQQEEDETERLIQEYLRTYKKDNTNKTTVTPTKKQEKRTWFQSGAFEDGFDLMDIPQTIAGTITDVRQDVTKGAQKLGEGIIDAGATAVGGVAKLFGQDKFAEDTKKFIAKDLIGGLGISEMTTNYTTTGFINNLLNGNMGVYKPSNLIEQGKNMLDVFDPDAELQRGTISESNVIEKNSLLGDKSDNLLQSAGQLAGTIALQSVGVPWYLTTGASSFGGEVENAFNNDATYGEAVTSGLISAGAEILTESLFKIPGIKATGSGELGKKILGTFGEKLSNTAVRNLANWGISLVGEGSEEVITSFFQRLGQSVTYEREETIKKLIEDEEARNEYVKQVGEKLFGKEARAEYGESFIGGVAIGGIAGAPKVYTSNKAGRDIETGLTDNEQRVIDSVKNQRTTEIQKERAVEERIKKVIAERESTFGTLSDAEKKNITNKIKEQLDNGELDYSTSKLTKKEIAKIEKEVQEDLAKGNIDIDAIEGTLSSQKTAQIKELQSQLDKTTNQEKKAQIQAQINELQSAKASEMSEILKKDYRLQPSYNEAIRKTQKFTYEAQDTDSEYKKALAEDFSRIANNTTKSHETFEMISKIAEEKQTSYGVINNEQLKELGYDVEGKDVNGLVRVNKDGTQKVLINIDSSKAINRIVGHETTHLLEGTQEYKELQQMVKEYATTKGEYGTRLKDLTKLYEGTNANIENELTADLVGDYLFTDADFVDSLSVQKTSIFKKIFDEIKHLYKLATAGSSEKRQLERVKKAFEEAYRKNAVQVEVQADTQSIADNKKLYDYAKENKMLVSATDNLAEILESGVFDAKRTSVGSYDKGTAISEYGKYKVHLKPEALDYVDKMYKGDGGTRSEFVKENKETFANVEELINNHPQTSTGQATYDELTFKNDIPTDLIEKVEIPEGTDQSVIDMLESKGIPYEFYTPKQKSNTNEDSLLSMFGKKAQKQPTVEKPSEGLTKEQQEYFKDSVVRDENGNLMVMYHGTSSGGHTVFDTYGSKYGLFGQGSYFTNDRSVAESYTEKGKGKNPQIYETYLNITNPIDMDAQADAEAWKKVLPDADFPASGTNEDFYRAMEEYYRDAEYSKWEASEEIIDVIQGMGYDGITHIGGGRFNKADETRHRVYIAFDSNQIKNVDNLNPTDDADIRYSLSEKSERAINELGVTDNIREAGYLTANGLYLDFSGKKYGSRGGSRQMDHRDISDIYTDEEYDVAEKKHPNMGSATAILQDFIEDGNIRLNGTGVEIATEPTAEQYSKLYDYLDFVKNDNGEVFIDLDTETKNRENLEYSSNVSVRKMISDIKNHYAQYSLSKPGEQIAPVRGDVFGSDIKYDASIPEVTEDIAPFRKPFELGYIPKDPTRAESYDFDDPVQDYFNKFIPDNAVQEAQEQPKSKLRRMVDTFKGQFVNRNVEIDNLARESGNKNIKFAGDMYNNVAGEIETDVNTAQTNMEGKAIGKSIKQIFQPSKDAGLYEAFNDYLIQKSNIERHKQGKGSVIPASTSQQLVIEYEKSYPKFKTWANDVYQYNRNILNNEVEAGLVSEDLASFLTNDIYPSYVPFYEVQDTSRYFNDRGELKPVNVLKRAKGGASKIAHIEESMIKQTYAYKRAIRQNQLYQQIVGTLDSEVSIGADVRTDPTQLDESLYVDENGNKYLTAYVKGEQKSVRITDELYNSLKNESEQRIRDLEERYSLISKPLQKVSEIRRNLLTTWSPSFVITNPLKDIQDAVFNSKYTKDMLKNYPGAFKELALGNTDTVKQFLALYGSGNTMGEFDIEQGKVKDQKNIKFLSKIPQINNIVELAPRYAEFKASLENGTSVNEAMYNAREITTNFGRGGTITKALNRNGFTFLNASVQGMDKFIRNFSGENGAKGVVGSIAKAFIFGVAPALLNAMFFDDDEEYEALPDYIKDNYYLIKTGDGEFVRIPKGRMISVFGSAGRRTLEFAQGNEDAYEGFLKNAYSQTGVSNPLTNNVFSPLIQAYGSENGEAWYGGDLVPSRLQDKPAEEQYDETTDEFSKWLGDKLKISPYKLNYVIDQYSGGIGDLVLPVITEEASSDGSLLAPLKDKFTANSTSDNKYVSEIYTLKDELTITANGSKATEEDKLKSKYIASVTSEMGKLYGERREVQNDESLTKAEKYEKAQAIKQEINKLAEEGLSKYENVSAMSNYATAGDKEYYLNTKNQWQKIDNDELEDLDSMGMTNLEKNSYFKTKNEISLIVSDYKEDREELDDIDKDAISMLSSEKKRNIINQIINSGLTDDEKAYLYDKYYSSDKTLDTVLNAGIDFNTYLDFASQEFEADYYTNGKIVTNSKKNKVISYVNSLDLSVPQKAILIRQQYSSFKRYNKQIVEYVGGLNITYEEKVALLENLDMVVDANGNVRWK